MFKKFLFKRVERWINGLESEYQTKAFVQASLGLLKILGMPTDFSKLLHQKQATEAGFISGADNAIVSLEISRAVHVTRENELERLELLLG